MLRASFSESGRFIDADGDNGGLGRALGSAGRLHAAPRHGAPGAQDANPQPAVVDGAKRDRAICSKRSAPR
jgi:hypothetical protein